MNAGRMDQPIAIERFTATPDGIGGTTQAWAALPENAAVWARVVTRPGGETMIAGRMTAQSPVTFTVYWRDDVTELDRIIWNGEAYQIRNVIRQGGRKLVLDIDCERGAAQ